jgi:secreted PhoX family phosphatase
MPGERHPEQHDRTPLVRERHGYVFEVDSRAEGLVDPVPIRAMGRFYHEAVAVDPVTAHVYMTEDRSDGLLYRYRPSIVESGTRAPSALRPGDLAKGGVLEALRIVKRPAARTHNWDERVIAVGEKLKVDWVRIPEVDPDVDCERDPTDPELDPLRRKPRAASGSTRAQGFALGAAQFARNEGILAVRGAIYMCATNGGPDKAGQVWKLDLARKEIELIYESSDKLLLEGPDNLCAAPFGDLIVCEDHPGRDRVIGITPNGRTYPIARNAQNDSEVAGACFSADGRTLFFNAQQPGTTFAVWGPWDKRGA